jgi:hypothetical protein
MTIVFNARDELELGECGQFRIDQSTALRIAERAFKEHQLKPVGELVAWLRSAPTSTGASEIPADEGHGDRMMYVVHDAIKGGQEIAARCLKCETDVAICDLVAKERDFSEKVGPFTMGTSGVTYHCPAGHYLLYVPLAVY